MTKKRITTRKNAVSLSTPSFTPSNRSFQDLVEIFLTAKKVEGKAARSLKDFRYNFSIFERWLSNEGFQNLKPVELDVSHFRSYVAYMTDRYSASTVNTRLTALKSLFKFLTEEGLLPLTTFVHKEKLKPNS